MRLATVCNKRIGKFNEQIIFWCYDQIPDPKILMHKTKNEIKMKQNSHLYIQKIRNQQGNAWAEITYEGNVETYGYVWSGGDSSSVQSQLKNVKAIVSTMSWRLTCERSRKAFTDAVYGAGVTDRF